MKKITSLLSLLLLFSAGIFAQSPGSGHCIGFNGSSQYGTASHPASYNVDTALTVEAWINPYSFGNNVILGTFGFNLFGAPQGYLLKVVTGGALAFESPMGTVTTPQNVLYSNDWFHIALVVNSNSLKFYVNGMLVHTAAHPGNIAGGTFPLHFGRSPYLGNPGHFHGEIDEVRIWDRAIGDLEIKAWMCKKITTGHSGYPYLVGYWRFDEGQGSAFLDSSPLVNQGTLMGQPMFGWSNAPIGDAALYSLTPPFSLHLSSTFGDTLHIDSVSGNPTAVHVYRVDLPPNFSGAPQGYSALDTTHHYGVFYVGGTPLFHGYFGFGGNAFYNGIPNCDVMLALRLQVEVVIECGHTINFGAAEIQRLGDHRQRGFRYMADLVLQVMQDFEQRIRPVAVLCTNGVGGVSCLARKIENGGFSGHAAVWQKQMTGANRLRQWLDRRAE